MYVVQLHYYTLNFYFCQYCNTVYFLPPMSVSQGGRFTYVPLLSTDTYCRSQESSFKLLRLYSEGQYRQKRNIPPAWGSKRYDLGILSFSEGFSASSDLSEQYAERSHEASGKAICIVYEWGLRKHWCFCWRYIITLSTTSSVPQKQIFLIFPIYILS